MKQNETFVKVSGFIDNSTKINGDIRFKDSFRIDGKFKGKIKSGNSLIVGESGDVQADINVNTVSVNGQVKGTVVATEKVEIFPNGSVTGSIVTPKLVIQEGAFFQGSCQMNLKAVGSGESADTEKKDEKKSSDTGPREPDKGPGKSK